MSATVSRSTKQREIKSVDGQLQMYPAVAVASQSPINCLDAHLIVEALVKALDDTMSRKEAALVMGKDPGQLSRQLASGHVTLLDLSKLGDEYWRGVAMNLRVAFDMLDRAELVAQGERHMERARWFFAQAAQR